MLLARRDGRMVDAATAAAVRASPPATSRSSRTLAAHGLTLALDAVMPFAHWVTPEVEIRRFDTRFLLARVPAEQDASHDDGEMTALEWLAPAEAVARGARGDIMLPPPTWITLKRLARFASVDEAWAWASTTPIVRIQPGFSRAGDVTTLMLPGDPTYPLPEGLEPLEDMRFELTDGAWRPVQSDVSIRRATLGDVIGSRSLRMRPCRRSSWPLCAAARVAQRAVAQLRRDPLIAFLDRPLGRHRHHPRPAGAGRAASGRRCSAVASCGSPG